MKPTLVLVGIAAGLVVFRIVTRRPEPKVQPDDMAVPSEDWVPMTAWMPYEFTSDGATITLTEVWRN